MGDVPAGSGPPPLDIAAAGLSRDEQHSPAYKPSSSNTPFHSQLSSIPQGQARPDLRSSLSPHFQAQEHGASPLHMGSMVGALPEYASVDPGQGNPQSQRQLSGASTSALVYQLQQNLQMPGHSPGSVPTHSPYDSGLASGQYQHTYAPNPGSHPNYPQFHSNQQRLPPQASMQPQYQGFPSPSQYMYYPPAYGPQSHFPQGYPPQSAQPQAMYGRRPSFPNAPVPMMGQGMDMSQHEALYSQGNRLVPGMAQGDQGPMGSILSGTFGTPGMLRSTPVSSIPRGPPRKPKQSGHALWVGNLPPGTTVVALKDHFSREATKDIESLFLISKSNCAFVNYRSEASCTAAMHRFHDSRFNGVRLVCRLRRSSAPASGVPTGPSAMVGSQPTNSSPPRSPQEAPGDNSDGMVDGVDEVLSPTSLDEAKAKSTATEKYFIVKSLTLQDLELSVRNGIWATQSHNEEALNKAYEAAENVYLIFSANKSGEYFGYARMASPILEDAQHLIGSAPKPEILDASDVPKSIPTPATEFAPKGRIIDDSARGTIFWEAELSDSELEESVTDAENEEAQMDGDASGTAQSWGKPFKVEWISTNRLPFYRTRGLRNPWNANREVKIARDGTELETSVGERLIQMFHRLGPSSAGLPMSAPGPQMRQF